MRNEVSAFVVYNNSIDAYFALKHLNNFKLEKLSMLLKLVWYG